MAVSGARRLAPNQRRLARANLKQVEMRPTTATATATTRAATTVTSDAKHPSCANKSAGLSWRAALALIALVDLVGPHFANLASVAAASVDYCYSDLGCFPLGDELYHPRHRPFNVRPWHRRHIGTEFELFSAHFPEGATIRPWDRLSLAASRFDPKLETKVIVPGWLDNVDRAVWVKHLRDALLYLWAPVNLVIVRWRNFTPYTVATANTRVVGAELANLIRFIEHELAYDRAYYHLIGHSLGAHIAGYCGDRLPGLGRITALDPARPFFQGMPKSVRLDRGDAKFVDAIHSDFTPENAIFLLMSFGMTTPVGHVDFYPNGPPLLQPGCLRDTIGAIQRGILRGLEYSSFQVTFIEALRYLTACDHQRSHEWFIESITNRECVFVGVRCSDYEGMINGRCTCDDSRSACAIMGIHADQMYLTGAHQDRWPLARGQRPSVVGVPQPRVPPSPVSAQPAAPLLPAVFQAPQSAAHALLDYPSAAPTREAVLAQLRAQLDRMRQPSEPSAAAGQLHQHQQLLDEPSNVVVAQAALDDYAGASSGQPASADELNAELLENIRAHQQWEDQPELAGAAQLALDDQIFIEYLRATILDGQRAGASLQTNHSDSRAAELSSAKVSPTEADGNKLVEYDSDTRRNGTVARGAAAARRQDHQEEAAAAFHEDQLLPPHIAGHVKLMSGYERDIEDWYESSSRWFLKTSNRPNYCSNQYQVLVFVGPLSSRSGGRERLRANLIISIVGSRGQLLNQRFVPRSASLDSFTMQPFFILLEGSYSLGQIKSVAIAWEQRHDPDPIKATISFENNALAALGTKVPAFRAKHPLLSETLTYDRSRDFRFHNRDKYAARRRADERRPTASDTTGAKLTARRDGLEAGNSAESEAPSAASRGHRRRRRRRHRYQQPQIKRQKRSASCWETMTTGFSKRRPSCQPRDSPSKTRRNDDYDDDDDATEEALSDYLENYYADMAHQAAANYEPPDEGPNLVDQTVGLPISVASGLLLDSTMVMPAPLTALAAGDLAGALRPSSLSDERESQFFEPLVDPIESGHLLVNKYPPHADNHLTLELHNLRHFQHQAQSLRDHHPHARHQDSIVINQVIVSPLRASYGQGGAPTGRAFCSPRRGMRLRRDQTVRLTPSLTSRCYENQALHV